MHVIEAANVVEALPRAVGYLLSYGKKEKTRVGDALVAQVPITIWYYHPKQHVLTNPFRDANPFFHLIEAMWMLAGRDDGKFLDYYIKNFSKDFGAPDGRIMDAYGYRWKFGLGYNQLNVIIDQLRENPSSRQCVLQMWGAGAQDDLMADKARPCNLIATFRVREDRLDMTVFNRSNDLIWGCCGANAVHFPIMQEYVATKLGLRIGGYWQVTTNLHMYELHIDMLKNRIIGNRDITIDVNLAHYLNIGFTQYGPTQDLMEYPNVFDNDLEETMAYIDALHLGEEGYSGNIANSFLRETVIPMATAHAHYKKKNMKEALETVQAVKAQDWQKAGYEWLMRRQQKVPRHPRG